MHAFSGQGFPSPNPTPSSSDCYLLERIVHQVLTDDRDAGRQLFTDALSAGQDALHLLANVLWPAVECIHQLRHDRLIATRLFNNAIRVLSQRITQITLTLQPEAPAIRPLRLFVMAAPGEPTDLSAQIAALLGEFHGFIVQFAGSDLTQEDVLFALTRLEPDGILMVGSAAASGEESRAMIDAIKRARLWPEAQLAVAGSMVTRGGTDFGSDVAAESIIEVLELMSLCPEVRRSKEEAPLHLLAGATPAVTLDPEVLHDFLCHRFPPGIGRN